ncbi:hypothetical protein Trydic_g3950 [Trypoxylus dichotomus]
MGLDMKKQVTNVCCLHWDSFLKIHIAGVFFLGGVDSNKSRFSRMVVLGHNSKLVRELPMSPDLAPRTSFSEN